MLELQLLIGISLSIMILKSHVMLNLLKMVTLSLFEGSNQETASLLCFAIKSFFP